MLKPLDLKVIAPQPVSLQIFDISGKEKIDLIMRPLNIDDQVWISEKYPTEELRVAFETMNMTVISAIIYRQLDNDSRKKLRAIEIEFIDEMGEEKTERLSGPQLLRRGISGQAHMLMVYQALMKCIGVSMPEIEEKDEVGDADEKKSN